MTPAEEKAKELTEWFKEIITIADKYGYLLPSEVLSQSKQCAIKVCDEKIASVNQCMLCKQSVRDFHKQVKTAINNYE